MFLNFITVSERYLSFRIENASLRNFIDNFNNRKNLGLIKKETVLDES